MPDRTVPERFLVAFSLAGEQRDKVRAIAEAVETQLGTSTVFLDEWYGYYLSGFDAAERLQEIYLSQSELVVICVSHDYQRKPWTATEFVAIRERLKQARQSGDRNAILRILPLRVADVPDPGILSDIFYLDHGHSQPDDIADVIVARLRLICPLPLRSVPANSLVAWPQQLSGSLIVRRVTDFRVDRKLIDVGVDLQLGRLPADEVYDREFTVDLIRRHLAEEFGPNWKIHLLVASFEQRCVGILMGYEDVGKAIIFVSFLAAKNPRRLDVSQKLTDALFTERENMGLHTSPRFLFEVDDPALGPIAKERRHRLARLKVFDRIAPFENLHLRVLDIPYVQPKMEWPSSAPDKRLLLCYAAPGLDRDMPRAEVAEIVRWVYRDLYAEDLFEQAWRRDQYGSYLQGLVETVTDNLPDRVRLLRCSDLETRCLSAGQS